MRRILCLCFLVVVGACQVLPSESPASADGREGRQIPITGATWTATVTRTVPPSATPRPSTTPTVEPSATVTPSPEPFPMSIEVMRARDYPGSPITIESELTASDRYHRYIAWYLSDGLKIYGLLTVPIGYRPEGGWPAIVFNHGYIEPSVYKTTERYVAYVDRLARAGYVVFRIDYRGHDRSEGEARGAYGDPGYTIDVLNAVASLKQFDEIDPEKIGMWGHSMGGYLTLRSMVITNDVKVGVIWSGVVGSYDEMLNQWPVAASPGNPDNGDWRQAWPEEHGTPAENPRFWDAIDANAYLADLSGPLQLHAARQDLDVPVSFSQSLADRVKAAGKDVELFIYDDDNHDLGIHFTQAMDRTIEFFDRYLK